MSVAPIMYLYLTHAPEVFMSTPSRYHTGGFSPRFVVIRTDGNPCRPDARYMVLDGSGADPHAVLALRVYAASVRSQNPTLADDIERMVGLTGSDGGVTTGGVWPPELAQHADAV